MPPSLTQTRRRQMRGLAAVGITLAALTATTVYAAPKFLSDRSISVDLFGLNVDLNLGQGRHAVALIFRGAD